MEQATCQGLGKEQAPAGGGGGGLLLRELREVPWG